MEQIITRKASLKDLETLIQFEQGIINAERPFDPTIKTGQTYYYNIVEMITADHIEIIVAESGSEIVGCGYARIENSKHFLKHQTHAYLGFMYVLQNHRGKGVNQKIINALKNWALTRGTTEMRLEVYSKNSAAVKAYEKAGFTEHITEMRISLEDDQKQ